MVTFEPLIDKKKTIAPFINTNQNPNRSKFFKDFYITGAQALMLS